MFSIKREFSAGGVIYKTEGTDRKIALIARKKGTIWCLPKGKIEKTEKAEATAQREIEEETGLKGRLVRHLGDVTYWFILPVDKVRVFKKVRFFLFRYINGSTKSHDYEVDDVRWFSINEALRLMSYSSERRIVMRAKAVLSRLK